MLDKLHSKFIENTPLLLRSKGAIKEALFVEENLEDFKKSVMCIDIIEFSFLRDFLPEGLRRNVPSKSKIKFEHLMLERVPSFLEDIFASICNRFGVRYRYADSAIKILYQKAKDNLKEDNKTEFIRNVGKCCHIIQDICIPMHCKEISKINDVFNIFNCVDPYHKKFEKYCNKIFKLQDIDFDLSIQFEIPETILQIAKQSRENFEKCSGVQFSSFIFETLKKLKFLKQNEEYKEIAKLAIATAQINTVLFIYKALNEGTKVL